MFYGKIINRYIAKLFTFYFSVSSITVISIIVSLSSIEAIVNSSDEISLKKIIFIILSNIPLVLEFVLPITTLIAALFLCSSLNDRSETIALLSAGLNRIQIFLIPVLPLLFLISLLLYFNQSYLARYLNSENSFYAGTQAKQSWFKYKDGFILSQDHDKALWQLEVKENKLNKMRYFEAGATYGEEIGFDRIDQNKISRSQIDQQTNIQLHTNQQQSALRFLPLIDLLMLLEKNKAMNIDNIRAQYYLLSKCSFFFTPLIMYILALPFSFYSSRSSKRGKLIGFGLIFGFLYLLFNQFSYLLFNAGVFNYFVGAISANAIFLFIALTLFIFKKA